MRRRRRRSRRREDRATARRPASRASSTVEPPARARRTPDDAATRYARDVVDGRIPACRWARLACKRHLRDLASGHKRGLWWDAEVVGDVEAFFRGLRHSKGEWAGQPIDLEPWQLFILGSIFGWKRADGLRRFRTAYVEVPRKNGKSTIAAGLGLLLAFFDDEPGAEVYSAATKRDQAKVVWSEARRMVRGSAELRQRIITLAANLHDPDAGSKFEPLGADADSTDGLNIHAAIVDELHAHKTRAMWDVLETATGARRQPLLFAITTAGSNRAGVCYETRTFLLKILEGTAPGDSVFGIVYTIDEGDDWSDPKSWAKANPNLGVSVKADELRRLAQKAKEIPSALPAFLTKHLDVWVNADSPWMPMDAWGKCKAAFTLEDLAGEVCWIALDLASKFDPAALAILFRRGDDYYLTTRFYLPEERIHDEAHAETAHFDAWARSGHLVLTPGNIIDHNVIEDEIRDLARRINPIQLPYDPYQATQLATTLLGEGLEMIEVPQTVKSLSEPMKELEALVVQGRFKHDGNPVMDWMISNVVCHRDAKDNVYPRKPAPNLKIDGAVAAIMALSRALLFVTPEPGRLTVLWGND